MRGRSPASAALAGAGQTTSRLTNNRAHVLLTSSIISSLGKDSTHVPRCAMIQVVKPTRRAKTSISGSTAQDAVTLPSIAVKTKVWLERDGQFAVGGGGRRLPPRLAQRRLSA